MSNQSDSNDFNGPNTNVYEDPLPAPTALALRNRPKSAFETLFLNNYPHPSEVPEGWIPTINPTSDLLHCVSEQAFHEAAEKMRKALGEYAVLKQEFIQFLKTKIKLNVITVNIEFSKLPDVHKGLNCSQVLHPDLSELTPRITCYFCEHLAIQPNSCSSCDRVYCLQCCLWLQSLLKALNFEVNESQFLCIARKCAISVIRSNSLVNFNVTTDEVIQKFYKEAYFICNRAFCKEFYLEPAFIAHLRSCHKGPIDFTTDKFLKLPFLSNNSESSPTKPNQLLNLLPYQLRRDVAGFPSIDQYWEHNFEGYAFLIDQYKDLNLNPCQLRSECNLGLNLYNNKELEKDPSAPINEGEEFLLRIGFPSVNPNIKFDPAVKHKHHLERRKGRIPEYLLKYTEWRKVFFSESGTDSVVSDSSSFILYSADIDDPNGPFLRINPYDRLNPDELSQIKQLLKDRFPSCVNAESIYRPPKKGSERSQLLCAERREKITAAFNKRPSPNLPPMKTIHMDEIEKGIESCTDKSLTFGISMFCCRIQEGNAKMPRPCWISIIDGNMEICYESFVQYKDFYHLDTRFHGLTRDDLKYARNLKAVRDQVIKFLACAKRIIGYGLINQLQALGLSRPEIMELTPKMRDVTIYYSPYLGSAMCLHFISFLWFNGYVLPHEPHNPIVENVTTMRLYMLNWEKIETSATRNNGIHFKNVEYTSWNNTTSALLYLFCLGQKVGKLQWPKEWKKNPRISNYPQFNTNCVNPDPTLINGILMKRHPGYKTLDLTERDTVLLEEALELFENESYLPGEPNDNTELPEESWNVDQAKDEVNDQANDQTQDSSPNSPNSFKTAKSDSETPQETQVKIWENFMKNN